MNKALSTHNEIEVTPTVLLGVTASIAAYKAIEIMRGLQKKGIRVQVVMTKHATEFVGPLTFEALSGLETPFAEFGPDGTAISHLDLAREADVMCIAPATANVIAKLAHGVGDDLLSTTAIAYQGPLVVAPAMNVAMYEDEINQANLSSLKARGAIIVEPETGYLACGDTGKGKLAEVDDIVAAVLFELEKRESLKGKRVVVNAGPTREKIDAVRFLSNRSSGEMGYEIAREAQRRGAKVSLISGPVCIDAPVGVKLIKVESALEMHEACMSEAKGADLFVGAAAVADYRAKDVANVKIKRSAEELVLTLTPNPDIVASVAALEEGRPFTLAFAAETCDIFENATKKLEAKGVDLVAANDVSKSDWGFDSPYNQLHVIGKDEKHLIERAPKRQVASSLLDILATRI